MGRGIKSAAVSSVVFALLISVLVFVFAGPAAALCQARGDRDPGGGVSTCALRGLLWHWHPVFAVRPVPGHQRPGMSLVRRSSPWGTRVALAYILSAIPAIGVVGIWWSVPIGWALADVTGVLYYKSSGGSWRAALGRLERRKNYEIGPALSLCDHRRPGRQACPAGPPLVFDNEITAQEGALRTAPLRRAQPQGAVSGHGYYNSHSKIRVRLLSQNANDKFDQAFFARRAQYAWDYRKTVMGPDADSCRVIFGGGGPLPRPDRGQVWGHPGHPDVVPGHRAAQGLDLPCLGTGHRGRRRAHPGHL